jgi:hypothetical protein
MLPFFAQVTCLHRPPIPQVLRRRVVLVNDALAPIGNRRTDKATHLANYSGKATKPGMTVQVLSDLDGCLLTVSPPAPGHTHDHTGFALAGYDHLLADIPTNGDLTGYRGRLRELANIIRHITTPEYYRPGW